MVDICLLNKKQFADDFKKKCASSNVLRFEMRYTNIANCLYVTKLILDLQNIIMTYVNDEVDMMYTIDDTSRYQIKMVIYELNANIQFEECNFLFKHVIQPGKQDKYQKYNVVIFSPNNVISNRRQHTHNRMELCEYAYHLFQLFGNEHDIKLSKWTIGHQYSKINDMTYRYHVTTFSYSIIFILNSRLFYYLVWIMKMIDEELYGNGV